MKRQTQSLFSKPSLAFLLDINFITLMSKLKAFSQRILISLSIEFKNAREMLTINFTLDEQSNEEKTKIDYSEIYPSCYVIYNLIIISTYI